MLLCSEIVTKIRQGWNYRCTFNQDLRTYIFFIIARIVLVFIPQRGYVHPDEFFQSTEVFTGEHFQIEHKRTWEFDNTMPIRSATLPFLLFRIPWSFFEFFAMYIREYVDIELIGSYTYLVYPRLVMCLVSFVNDWCLYRVCQLYKLRYEIRLLALSSSFVMLVYGTRTFSNTIEMALCSLLFYLVADSMIKTSATVYKKKFLEEKYEKATTLGERVNIWKIEKTIQLYNYEHLLLMSTICVVGVFNRPTFLLFGAPMVFHWMLRGLGSKIVTFTIFNLRMLVFCLCAVPAMVFFIFCDSIYYKYLTAGELQVFRVGIDNFIFVPWNFIKYNLDPNKTAEHGLHPKYVHLLVNIPLLYNVLGIVAIASFGQLLIRFFRAEYQGLPRIQSILGLMLAAIFVPVFFLSLINHQEARFIISITFPLILLHSPKLTTGFCATYPFKDERPALRALYSRILCTTASRKFTLKTWYAANVFLTIFFGFIHQAGVFPLAQYVEREMQLKPRGQHIHLITSHMYNIPVSFLNIPNSQRIFFNAKTGQRYRRQKEFYLYEYGSLDLTTMMSKLTLILSHCEFKKAHGQQSYRILIAMPTSLSHDFENIIRESNVTSYAAYNLTATFYPHLSTEALPYLFAIPPSYSCSHMMRHNSDDICLIEDSAFLSFSYMNQHLSSILRQLGVALYELRTLL